VQGKQKLSLFLTKQKSLQDFNNPFFKSMVTDAPSNKNLVFVMQRVTIKGYVLLLFLRIQNKNKHASALRLIVTLRVTMVSYAQLSLLKSKILKAYCWRSLLFPKGKQSETIKGFALACKLLVSYPFSFPYPCRIRETNKPQYLQGLRKGHQIEDFKSILL